MRISDVRSMVLGTPWRNLTIVKVTTDEGLVGVGEVRMVGHTQALLGYLAEGAPRHVLGSNPFRTEEFVLAHPAQAVDFNLFREGWQRRQQALGPVG